MNSKTKGILCIVTAAFCFAFMSLCVRLAGDLPSMQKILFRNLLALVIVGVGLIRKPEKIEVHKEDIKYLFLRSFCGTIGIVCNFYAIDHLVLSDANMLNKLSPFFAIIFSYFLLKEKADPVSGRSGSSGFYRCFVYHQAYRKYGKFRCFCRYDGRRRSRCCVYLCAPVRKKRGQWKIGDHVLFCFSCLTAAVFLIGHFAPMAWWQIVAMIGAGFGGAGGQIFVTKAYYYAPAKELSVFDYSQILFSALMGFVVLGQKPDLYSILGYVIICSTAIVMFLYNKNGDKIKQ